MIRVRHDGEERELSYGDFIREVQEGRITRDTPVLSDVLTSGVWKPAGELQFFRSWAPREAGAARSDPRAWSARPDSRAGSAVPDSRAGSVGPEWPVREGSERAGSGPPEPGPTEEEPGAPPATQTGGSVGEPWVPYGDRRASAPPIGYPPPPAVPPRRPAGWEQSTSHEIPPGPPIPWEEMDTRGFFGGLVETIRLAFRNPEEFFHGIGRGRGLMSAMVFGLLLTALSIAVKSAYDLLTIRLFAGTFQEMQSQLPEFLRGDFVGNARQGVLMGAVYILFYPLFVFLSSGLVHLMLRALGRPRGDFATTFRVMNYASAVDVLMIIPVCGSLIVYVWEIVLMVRGLSRLHGMGVVPVLAAIILPLVFMICLWTQLMALSGILQGVSSLPGVGGTS